MTTVKMFGLAGADGEVFEVSRSPFSLRQGWTETWTDPALQKWRHWYRKGYRVIPVLVTPAPRKPRRKK